MDPEIFPAPSVAATDAPTFFHEHGIYYEENHGISKLVEESRAKGLTKVTLDVKRGLPEDSVRTLLRARSPFSNHRLVPCQNSGAL